MTRVSERSYVAGRKVNLLKSTNDGRLESHGCKVKAFMNIGKLTYPLIRLSQITEPSYDGRFATETTLEDMSPFSQS